MPKFQDLTEAFWHIGEHPSEYLPEKSLALFQAFWSGYEWRYDVTFPDVRVFELLDGFHEFAAFKYQAGTTTSMGAQTFARLYSNSEAEAFDRWFADLKEFLKWEDKYSAHSEYFLKVKEDWTRRREAQAKNYPGKGLDFNSFLKAIITRPAMYLGRTSFSLIVSMISGWLRAVEDFDLTESEQEKNFGNFRSYLEERPAYLRPINDSGLPPRPTWNRIIMTNSRNEEKALEVFRDYVEEFIFQAKGHIENVEYHWNNQKKREGLS